MNGATKRIISAVLLASLASACNPVQHSAPSAPSRSNVNPITGERGGH